MVTISDEARARTATAASAASCPRNEEAWIEEEESRAGLTAAWLRDSTPAIAACIARFGIFAAEAIPHPYVAAWRAKLFLLE
jgi:hypothetical protein